MTVKKGRWLVKGSKPYRIAMEAYRKGWPIWDQFHPQVQDQIMTAARYEDRLLELLDLGGEEAVLALGREVFQVTAGGVGCALCHGSRGEGTPYGPRIAGRSREDIVGALRWAGDMANIDLTAEELDGVALYVAQLGR